MVVGGWWLVVGGFCCALSSRDLVGAFDFMIEEVGLGFYVL